MKCSEDLGQSCRRGTEIGCSGRSWCGTPGHGTAGPCSFHQCPFSEDNLLVPFHTSLLLPARRAQTWEKTLALPLPTPPVLESAASPASTHKTRVQGEFPAVPALSNHGASAQPFLPFSAWQPLHMDGCAAWKAQMLFLFLMGVVFQQALVFHNWCNRRHRHWGDWFLLEHKAFPVLHWPRAITSPSAPVSGRIPGL